MAYILSGSEGSFAFSSGDSFYSGFLSACTVSAWSLSINSETHDVTALNATNLKSLSGLRSYSASISGFAYAIPRVGNLGLVTMANPSFYTTNARAWSLTIEPYAVHDTTSYHASAPGSGATWRTFRPDSILRWAGSYTCGVDSAAAIVTGGSGTEPIQAPSITDDTGTTDLSNITLTYGDSAADESFTGEVQVVGYSPVTRRGEKQEITAGFVGSGPLTATGTNILFTGNGISTGVVLAPVWAGNGSASAALVARFYTKTASTSKYFETAEMFWRRITISAEVGQPVSFTMDLQGSGVLTSN